MDEIEHIFPEDADRAAESGSKIYNGQSARAALTVYRTSLRAREERLRRQLADLESREPLVEELHVYVRSRFRDKWPLHVIDWFSRNSLLVDEIKHDKGSTLASALEVILEEAKGQAEELKKRYSSRMDQTAKDMSFKPDKTSRHPVYRFCNGFFTVTIAEPSYTARIEDLAGPLVDRMPADPNAVIAYLKQEYGRVFGRPFDRQAFLQKLLKNYLAIIEKDPTLKEGDPIGIRRITSRLHDNEKNFHNDEFLRDLTQLLEAGVAQIDGWTLVLEQTKDIDRGLYVFPKNGAGYVGFLRFVRRG
ncbi:MAG: hypothetical protein ACPL2N_06230 [Candidatus Cryosericum sp.]